MGLGAQNHHRDGLLGPNSIMLVYMDPLGTLDPNPKPNRAPRRYGAVRGGPVQGWGASLA